MTKTFVEIGVSDFNTLEQLIDNGWEGYFVEPVKRYANKLRAKGYKNVSECAISSFNGDLEMYQSKEQNDDDMLWINGISHAVDQSGSKLLEIPINQQYVDDIITVPCYTLDEYFRVNNITEIDGQYIGLMKFNSEGTEIIKNFYEKSKKQSQNGKNPLNEKIPFENSYMTDLLQGLIKNSLHLNPVFINGGWIELDSLDDYNLYKKLYKENKLKELINFEN